MKNLYTDERTLERFPSYGLAAVRPDHCTRFSLRLASPLRRAPHLIYRVTAFLKRGRASQRQVRETGWDYSCCLPGEAFSTVRTRNIFALWRFSRQRPILPTGAHANPCQWLCNRIVGLRVNTEICRTMTQVPEPCYLHFMGGYFDIYLRCPVCLTT